MGQCCSLHSSPSSHLLLSSTEGLTPFENKVWEIYYYYEVSCFLHSSRLHNKTTVDCKDSLLPWYSTSANHWIIFYGLEYDLRIYTCPVGWGWRIHRLHLCRGVRPPNECPEYDPKQSNGEVPVMLEYWGMWSTPSLPSFPGPLWPFVVVPDRALYMD